jgi:hypothetical protein
MNLTDEIVIIPVNTVIGKLEEVSSIVESFDEEIPDLVSTDDIDVKLPCKSMNKCTKLTDEQKQKLDALISKYSSVFSWSELDTGHTDLVKHSIHTGDAIPIRQPAYRIPVAMRDEITK